MKKQSGITLLALIILVIVMLILTGVVINSIMGGESLFTESAKAVEESNRKMLKEKIELAVIKLMSDGKTSITVEDVLEELVDEGLTTEEDENKDTHQVKTDDGYIYEINVNEKGEWDVTYVGQGQLERTELDVFLTKSTALITNKLTLNVSAKADSGITKYVAPDGTTKTYADQPKEIAETFEVSANGTYSISVTNKNGKTETAQIVVDNILAGVVGISSDKDGWTQGPVTVTISWPTGSAQGVQEVSQDGGSTWSTVTGTETVLSISTNCVVKAKVSNAEGVVSSAELTIDKIDTNPPSAPTIEGGGDTYALSRTISVRIDAVDNESEIDFYEYYLTASADLPTRETEATGVVGE